MLLEQNAGLVTHIRRLNETRSPPHDCTERTFLALSGPPGNGACLNQRDAGNQSRQGSLKRPSNLTRDPVFVEVDDGRLTFRAGLGIVEHHRVTPTRWHIENDHANLRVPPLGNQVSTAHVGEGIEPRRESIAFCGCHDEQIEALADPGGEFPQPDHDMAYPSPRDYAFSLNS
ncbi:hypothetical protein ACWCPO_02705 [Streptomyces albidoflavus]